MDTLPAAALAAVAEVALTHPLDTLKVRLQTGHALSHPLRWAYQGVGIRMLGVLPMRSVYWTAMDAFSSRIPDSPIVAGALAGLCQTAIDTPIETMKIMRMTGAQSRDIQRTGLRTLFRGAGWNALRNSGFAAGVCAGRAWTDDSPLGAAAGAVAGSFLTHPFDTLKSRAQAHAVDPGQSAASLWRGVIPRCALSFSTMFVGSFAFRAAKQHLFD